MFFCKWFANSAGGNHARDRFCGLWLQFQRRQSRRRYGNMQPAAPTVVDCVQVVSRKLNITIPLPGELQPYEEVRIFPKVSGFVKWIGVDRGSKVKQGQLLAVLGSAGNCCAEV